ncbi:MAG: RIP metalloprotease RseP [Verrucomicrobia bacterium]|nr:RIP metalloprotease RseP [Verrucomicrobiota bacterium]
MISDLTNFLTAYVWPAILVIVLFGGSIFVHELGHFLAARRRGAHVERFSIGFGPAIWSWRGKDGVEYRLSWFPLGGYVLLPQLADLGAIEGESTADVAKLPPVNYATKMIVFVMGAVFNILFAFALACVVWVIGQPVATSLSTTTIAEVLPKIRTTEGHEVVSPAVKAGLKAGDTVVAVDGKRVEGFTDIVEALALSSGWNKQGERQTVFSIRRGNETLDVPITPVISGPEKVRMVGFSPVQKLLVGRVAPNTPTEKSGLRVDDEIVAVNDTPTRNVNQLVEALRAGAQKPIALTVVRAGQKQSLTLERPKDQKDGADIGVALKTGVTYTHPSPFAQIADCVVKTFRYLWAQVNPRSDIGLSHLSGPIGIISNFVDASRAGLPFALWFTILVNVNLAVLNLMPLPVLDGGQMLFATIGRLRGRALPANFIVAAQSAFLVLILSVMLYVSVFDVRRIARDMKAERAERNEAPAATTPPAK